MVIGWSGVPARIDVCGDGCIDVLLSDHPTAVSRWGIDKLWFQFGTTRETLPSLAREGDGQGPIQRRTPGGVRVKREFLVQCRSAAAASGIPDRTVRPA